MHVVFPDRAWDEVQLIRDRDTASRQELEALKRDLEGRQACAPAHLSAPNGALKPSPPKRTKASA